MDVFFNGLLRSAMSIVLKALWWPRYGPTPTATAISPFRVSRLQNAAWDLLWWGGLCSQLWIPYALRLAEAEGIRVAGRAAGPGPSKEWLDLRRGTSNVRTIASPSPEGPRRLAVFAFFWCKFCVEQTPGTQYGSLFLLEKNWSLFSAFIQISFISWTGFFFFFQLFSLTQF